MFMARDCDGYVHSGYDRGGGGVHDGYGGTGLVDGLFGLVDVAVSGGGVKTMIDWFGESLVVKAVITVTDQTKRLLL